MGRSGISLPQPAKNTVRRNVNTTMQRATFKGRQEAGTPGRQVPETPTSLLSLSPGAQTLVCGRGTLFPPPPPSVKVHT